ncbi:MAG: cysteine hydrolase [Alphaproteobacteria bacterium]
MPDDSAYLVLDMINDLVHEDGPNGKGPYGVQIRDNNVIARTARALDRAHGAGARVGYVRLGFSPDYRECSRISPIFTKAREAGLFKLGTWGTEVHPAIAPGSDDLDIVKHRVSPFFGTNLEEILRALGIRRLFFSGVSTNAVVQSAVREGHDRDFQCFVLTDCCAALSAAEHETALTNLARFAVQTTGAEAPFGG